MRSSHLVIGVAVVVMGYALMVIALARQAERTTANSPTPACVPTDTVARPNVPAAEPPVTTTTAGAAASPSSSGTTAASSAASPSAASSAAPVSDAGDATSDENRLFRFSAGGATMSREEVLRVFALGKAIAHHPGAKVAIEGFGDMPGTDPLMMGIAKHRAKVGQTLLGKAGVTEDRVTVSFSDMGSDARLARSIRVTTTPPVSEVEKP
jgi:outer membrane protein OmpA-like peptidoglycan-associated protein